MLKLMLACQLVLYISTCGNPKSTGIRTPACPTGHLQAGEPATSSKLLACRYLGVAFFPAAIHVTLLNTSLPYRLNQYP